MPSGSADSIDDLPDIPRAIVEEARRAVLSTVDSSSGPHSVPVVFSIVRGEIVMPIDAKPKSAHKLQRVKNVEANPESAVLFDRWDEEWTRLGWVMARGPVRVASIGDDAGALRSRYPQYADVDVGTEALVMSPRSVTWWTWS